MIRPVFEAMARIVPILLLVTMSALVGAQLPSIAQAPPPIVFPQWHEVDENDDGTEYSVEFPSAIVTPYPENNVVPLRLFVPIDAAGPVPVVLILHYWGATDLRQERAQAQELNAAGIAAALITLPYHLSRTPAGSRSGQLTIEPDPAKMQRTMVQAVWDVRRSVDFLVTRTDFDSSKIGIEGTSLGALIAALAFSVDNRISSAAFLLGGVDLAHIVWDSSLVLAQKDALRRRGFTEEKLRTQLVAIEPLTYLPLRSPVPTFVVGAKFDSVIPLESTRELISALKDPKVLWLNTGHYGGIFVEHRLDSEVASFFGSVFLHSDYAVPKTLYAPTLRVGVKADTGSGYDVALGLDLLRLDRRGEGFASLLLTPRGFELFAGRKLTPALALGAVFTMRSAGLGVLWSAVL